MSGFAFARHETFYIRDGWLYKGILAIDENPLFFSHEDAPQRLGLGKNMVKSLRYWMIATGLAKERTQSEGRGLELTRFGSLVLAHDPHQELDGTLWLLHYHLVANREIATAWYWFFNHYVPTKFHREEFMERLTQWVNLSSEEVKSAVSLSRDFDCLVRTYMPNLRNKNPENTLQSPLSSLGLFTEIDHHDEKADHIKRFRLNAMKANNIPPLIFLYVMLKSQGVNAQQISLTNALREPKNVGRVFNIGSQTLEELLIRLDETYPEFSIDLVRTGGLDQLTLPNVAPEEVLEIFYTRNKDSEDVRVWSFQIS
ncbi:MAG: DUF4007 family protein [bacterium]|nr:DUF4007 family protein [bacterium]